MGTVTLGRHPHNVTYNNGCPVIGVPGSSLRTFASATAGAAAVRKRSGPALRDRRARAGHLREVRGNRAQAHGFGAGVTSQRATREWERGPVGPGYREVRR